MVDIDNFKKINDTYGHPAGDFILKILADLFNRNGRASDFAVRFGGEGFFVVVPGASSVDCFRLMERIRNQAAAIKVQYGAYSLGFTFSGGIASFPSAKIGDANAWIQRVDDAPYKAKEGGLPPFYAIWIQLFQAVGAKAVAGIGFRMLVNVFLDLGPISLVVADLLAAGADGEQPAQLRDLVERLRC